MALTYFKDGAWQPLGGLVSVKHALKTDVETFTSVDSGDDRAISGLSITHEVANANNLLIITATIGNSGTTGGEAGVSMAVNDGSAFIGIGDAAGSRLRILAGGVKATNFFNIIVGDISATFVHSPGSGSKTYTLHAINTRNIARDVFINRTNGDANGVEGPRSISSLVIQEVSV